MRRILCSVGDLTGPANREGMEATRHIIALKTRPDALVCGNDVVAFGAMPLLEQTGLRIGANIAVTSIGDVPQAATRRPPLTTLQTEQGGSAKLPCGCCCVASSNPVPRRTG
jgi:LacI family transcriptional regulator